MNCNKKKTAAAAAAAEAADDVEETKRRIENRLRYFSEDFRPKTGVNRNYNNLSTSKLYDNNGRLILKLNKNKNNSITTHSHSNRIRSKSAALQPPPLLPNVNQQLQQQQQQQQQQLEMTIKVASAADNYYDSGSSSSVWNRYDSYVQSSGFYQQQENNQQFVDANAVKTVAYRPMTSNAFRTPFNLGDPIGITTYDDQFHKKEIRRVEPIRTGTSSGTRCHKPHPTHDFMVFRFKPLKAITNPQSKWSQSLGDTLMQQVIKNQMKSTYASDYVNNVDQKAKFAEEYKHLTTTNAADVETADLQQRLKKKQQQQQKQQQFDRFIYNKPFSYENLFISPTRYGCNKNHQKAASGIIPGCSTFHLNYFKGHGQGQ